MKKFNAIRRNAGKVISKLGSDVGSIAWPITLVSWGLWFIGAGLQSGTTDDKISISITTPGADAEQKKE